jgi:5-methylcytosine-specific restriction endonuclease McrA
MARTNLSKSKKIEVFKKYDYKCNDCSAPGLLEIHHILPICEGGTNDINNLVLVCMVCHVIRHGGTPKKLITDSYWISARRAKGRYINA